VAHAKLPLIGVLTLIKTDERSLAHELREGLRELNYIEGPAATLLALGWMF
jgi:hypothetical protein